MKDVQLNKFDANQRRLLQFGVILILLLSLGLYFFIQHKDSFFQSNEVSLENSKLQVFTDTYTYNGYPDRISVHYPYFIFVQANKSLTTVYNLDTKQKEKEINEILLDYYDGNIVYNKKETYFNDKNLGEFCDSAFIKKSDEILCITRQSQNYIANMLINITPETPNLWKRDYQSDNLLTTVSVINGELYLGEINFETKQNYLTVNGQTIPVESPVNMIYEMRGKPYYVSLKSQLNNNTTNYYSISEEGIIKQEENRIFFYK